MFRFDLRGKVVIIIGLSKGIGLVMVEVMVECGVKVVISSRK